ncbi:MAG: hypothetical protein H5U40_13910 [Polyangiaceae bacterium]|nr:hypothetical protein [Polyangiaceae bacterium]
MDRVGVVLVSGMPRDELSKLAAAADADAVVPKDDIETRLNEAVLVAQKKRAS